MTMNMSPGVRKLALTAHVMSSVGWLGAVVVFLVLSIAGLTSRDVEIVRGVYLAMNLIGEFVIVPLSVAALLTGIIQSLGTPWGLFRYYWVVVKLVLTIGATLLLLLHQFTAVAGAAKRVAGSAPRTLPDLGNAGSQLAGDASAAITVLVAITFIAVYKPWGLTRFGQAKQSAGQAASVANGDSIVPLGLKVFLVVVGLGVVGLIIWRHAAGGFAHHGH